MAIFRGRNIFRFQHLNGLWSAKFSRKQFPLIERNELFKKLINETLLNYYLKYILYGYLLNALVMRLIIVLIH